MADLWAALLLSFGVVFVAELGDKSQLLALAFATRYKAWQVLAGIAAATLLVHLGSVVIGHGLGEALPTSWITLVGAVAFLGFAVWTWRGDVLSEKERSRVALNRRTAVVAVGTAFFLAELGDKTMLATVTLATAHDWIGVWIGSTVGMVAADALAVIVGRVLGQRLPEHIVRYGAALLFLLFGVWLLADAVAQLR